MRWNKASKMISLMLLILATLTSLLFTGCSSIINADGREQTSEDIEKANDVKENSPSKKILSKTGETIKES